MLAYHYSRYRKLWEGIDQLTESQFLQAEAYSVGSIHFHMVHMASTDDRWLGRLTDTPLPERRDPADFPDRASTRSLWNRVEAKVLDFAANITDTALLKPITFELKRINDPIVRPVTVSSWQIVLHIVNHGTDHCAQILHLLHNYGAPTFEQDYILYLRDQN